MAIVRFHPAADKELLEAVEWYLARSTTAATSFAREIERALARITDGPERYPLTRLGGRRFVLLNFPYDIVYRSGRGEIEVIAVAHHARRPEYWRRR